MSLRITLAVAVLHLALVGCSLRLHRPARPPIYCKACGRMMAVAPAPPSEHCNTLSNTSLAMSLLGGVAGVGASTTGALALDTDNQAVKLPLTLTASGLSAVGALTAILAPYYAARWTKECQ